MFKKAVFLGLVGVLFVCVFVSALTIANENGETHLNTMDSANQLHLAGHYPEAIQTYQQIIDQGVQDGAVYYNLGNAYFKNGDLGRAILNYQRAARLDPRDVDIQRNLELARSQTTSQFTSVPGGPLKSLANLTRRWLSLNEVAIFALAMWLAFIWVLLAWRGTKIGGGNTALGYAAIILLFLLFIIGASFGSRFYLADNQSDGVIVAPVVTVHDEPLETESTDLNLYGGTEVKLLEFKDEWIRFSMPGDNIGGWLPLDAVELIAL